MIQAITEPSSSDTEPDSPLYFAYQVEGICFAIRREATLLADEMGLGKSAQAIGVINASLLVQTVLIVCPAVMRLVWRRELERWLSRPYSIGVVGIDKDARYADIVVCNYDRLSTPWVRERLRQQWDVAILDECHYCKNPKSKRSHLTMSIQATKRLALSGTPLLNHPTELRPILTWLDPITWPRCEWFQFSQRYGGAIFNGFGWKYTGATNLEELSIRLRSSVMIRRTKAEVLPDLPNKLRTIIELEPGSNIAGLVKAELEAFERFEAIAGESETDGYAEAVKELKCAWRQEWDNLAKARRLTAIAKIPYVLEFISESLLAGSQKIVLWCHHREVAFALQEGLATYQPALVLGGMTPLTRQTEIDRFQTDPESRVFIGGITAAGVGITLTAASHCVFAELSWVPAEICQAEDRLHRIGQHDSVLIQHLVLAGSLDSVMARRLIKKQEILDKVLGAS
jgi:SWI/SNF-related matrix-associated actin-dependent regulator of chromatin subfamily A-like protein 1